MTFPDPADLYSEVAAKSSLAAALQAVAAELGFVLGEVVANEEEPLRYAAVTSLTPLRDSLAISIGELERFWTINGWGQGIWIVTGMTRDLTEVVRAAKAWRDGVPLRDIVRDVPFVELARLAITAGRP